MKKLADYKKPEYGITKIFPIFFGKTCDCCQYTYKYTWMWQFLRYDSLVNNPPYIKREKDCYVDILPCFICLDCAPTIQDVIKYRESM